MQDIINNFKNQIKSDGVSQGDIKLLEDTMGEKVISSTVSLKNFTSERSSIGIDLVSDILDNYVPESSVTKKVYTKEDYVRINNNHIKSMEDLANILASLTKTYSEDKKNTLFNLKSRYTFNNSDGSSETVVWDMFSKKYNMTNFLNDVGFIREACKEDKAVNVIDKIQTFKYSLEKNGENSNVNWSVGGFDTFISMGLILNKEFDSYVYSIAFTPMILTGEDMINFLDNSYVHYEYVNNIVKDLSYIYKDTLIRMGKDINVWNGMNLDYLERLEFITEKNKITIEFLNILKSIFDSMSNQ